MPNWEKQTWYWEKRWLFSIGNGAEIRPLEKGRKCPAVFCFLPHDARPYLTERLLMGCKEPNQTLPNDAISWSVILDCGISWSYSLVDISVGLPIFVPSFIT